MIPSEGEKEIMHGIDRPARASVVMRSGGAEVSIPNGLSLPFHVWVYGPGPGPEVSQFGADSAADQEGTERERMVIALQTAQPCF